MRTVEFRRLLESNNALRVLFDTEHGQIVRFAVQLECQFGDDEWVAVVRYDTAHGYAHRDTMHPYEKAHRNASKENVTERKVRFSEVIQFYCSPGG